MANKLICLLLVVWLVVACETGGPRPAAPASSGEAQATYMAIAAEETRRADSSQATIAAATAQAAGEATGTAVAVGYTQTATADALNTAATTSALYIVATREAAAARATAVDLEHQARMVEWAAADEARRLAIQRESEAQWLRTRAVLSAAAAVAIILAGAGLGLYLWRRSQPWIVSLPENGAIIGSGDQRLLEPGRQPRITISEPEPLALPVPQVQPLPELAAGHALVAGETGSGKTTALRAILHPRPEVIILDPHARAGQWPDYEVIGGGRNWQAIAEFLERMDGELNVRYQRRLHGDANFHPLTIATDEMNSIVQEVGQEIGRMWRQWLREGRKVSLYFVTSSHSTRVGPLGIKGEGDLLLNFHSVVMLGKVAQEKYGDLVRGMERPAVLATQSGARPVIIPHIPEAGGGVARPYVASSLREESGPRSINTDWGVITPNDVIRALRMYEAGASRRNIEEAIYGHAGGAAYNKVKFILERGATHFGVHHIRATE
jgi:hypothetical protein